MHLIFYNALYIRHQLASSCHIPTKFIHALRRTALIFATQGVGASCMCDGVLTVCDVLKTQHLKVAPHVKLPLAERSPTRGPYLGLHLK